MSVLAIVLIILGILLFLPGLFIGTVKFLLWVGIVLAIIGFIIWAVRFLRSGTRE